jgi:hypothetical protein
MRFHWPSFMLGYAAGAGSAMAWDRLRPLAVEVAAAAYRAFDSAAARVVMVREDVQDILAEARARVRGVEHRAAAQVH